MQSFSTSIKSNIGRFLGHPVNLYLYQRQFKPVSDSSVKRLAFMELLYQPKIVGETADFETLIPYISRKSSQMCTYFCKDRVLSVPGKNILFPIVIRFQNVSTHTLLLWA